MTLRARLVAGLVVLMTLGLAIFGVTMYELYSRSQYDQLTSELQSSVPLVTRELSRAAGVYLPVGGQGGTREITAPAQTPGRHREGPWREAHRREEAQAGRRCSSRRAPTASS